MGSVLDSKHFRDEAAAYKWVEARVWPNGRVCPHCGSVDDSGPLQGKSTRIGVYKCYAKACSVKALAALKLIPRISAAARAPMKTFAPVARGR
jgi:hypothetical protein